MPNEISTEHQPTAQQWLEVALLATLRMGTAPGDPRDPRERAKLVRKLALYADKISDAVAVDGARWKGRSK